MHSLSSSPHRVRRRDRTGSVRVGGRDVSALGPARTARPGTALVPVARVSGWREEADR